MANGDPQKKLSVTEFATKVKSKYPSYKDMDDSELVAKMIQKYPQYEKLVDLKKKEDTGSLPSSPMDSTGLESRKTQEPTSSGSLQPTTQPFSQVSVKPTEQEILAQRPAPTQKEPQMLGEQIMAESGVTAPERPKEKSPFQAITEINIPESLKGTYAENILRRADVGSARAISGLLDLPKTIYEVVTMPQNKAAEKIDAPWLKALPYEKMVEEAGVVGLPAKELMDISEGEVEYAKKRSEELASRYDKSIEQSIKDGEYLNAIKQAGELVAENAPNMALIMMTGGGGGTVAAAGALTYPDLKRGLDEKYPEMSEEDKVATAAAMSTWEGLMEMFTARIGNAAFGIYQREGADAARQAIIDQGKPFIERLAKKMTTTPYLQPVGEFGTEYLTQVAQNATEIMSAEGRMPTVQEMTDGAMDAGLVGFLSATGPAAMTAATQRNQQIPQEDVSEDQTRMAGEVREWQEPVQEQPQQSTSEEAVSDGGMVQETQQQEVVTPTEETTKEATQTVEEQTTEQAPTEQQTEATTAEVIADKVANNQELTFDEEQYYSENASEVESIVSNKNATNEFNQKVQQKVQEVADKGLTKTELKQEISSLLNEEKLAGGINDRQLKAVIRRSTNLDPQKPQTINDFMQYVDKVRQDADYAENVSIADRQQKRARKSLRKGTKFGLDKNAVLDRAFKADIKQMSPNQLREYNSFITEANKVSPNLEKVTEQAKKFADFYRPKESTVKEETQVEVDEIEDAALNDEILRKDTQMEVKDFTDSQDIDFIQSITQEDLEGMSVNDKRKALAAIKNRQRGFKNKDFYDLERDVKANRKKKELLNTVQDGKMSTLLRDKILNPIKELMNVHANNALGRALSAKTPQEMIKDMLRHIPLKEVDMYLSKADGNLYESFLYPAARARENVTATTQKFLKTLDNIIPQSTTKKWRQSQIKMMLISLQKQHLANIDNEFFEALPAVDYLVATEQKAKEMDDKSRMESAQEVREVFDKFTNENGEFDLDKAEKSLTPKERKFMQVIDSFKDNMSYMAETAAARRGETFRAGEEYVKLNVDYNQQHTLEEIVEQANRYFPKATQQPKAGETIARTRGAKPINFIYQNVMYDALKSVSTDYHYGVELSSADKAFRDLMSDPNLTDEQRSIAGAFRDVMSEAVEVDFMQGYYDPSDILKQVEQLLNKRGYQLALAGLGRSSNEALSNVVHAMVYKPSEFTMGMEMMMDSLKPNSELGGNNFFNLAQQAGSTQLTRMFGKNTGKMMEMGIADYVSNSKWGKKVDDVADFLISKPDQMVARALWAGSFYRTFKKQTGMDFSIKEFMSNKEYRLNNREAFDNARQEADSNVVDAVASTNVYEGVLASTVKPTDNRLQKYSKFMTRFARYEFTSAAKAVQGLVGRGKLTRRQGAALLSATIARMTVYSALGQVLGELPAYLINLAFGNDDKEFVENLGEANPLTEDGALKWTRSFIGSIVSLLFSRRLGNFSKAGINYGIEVANREYLGFLRGGKDYDTYKYNMVFSTLPVAGVDGGKPLGIDAFIIPSLGALAPFARTATRGVNRIDVARNAKKQETRDKAMNEIYARIIPELMFETVGMPFAKDIRKAIMMNIFKEYRQGDTKKEKPTNVKVSSEKPKRIRIR